MSWLPLVDVMPVDNLDSVFVMENTISIKWYNDEDLNIVMYKKEFDCDKEVCFGVIKHWKLICGHVNDKW